MSKTTCAVTMVYNEGHFLPIWLAYYGRELGEENLFVIDHGSDGALRAEMRSGQGERD